MATTDAQTIVDLEQGLKDAQNTLHIAEAHLERKQAELVEAQAAEGAAIDAIGAYQAEFDAIMNVSRERGEMVLLNDAMWRARYPRGAAAADRRQALEQARQDAVAWVLRLSNGYDGAISRAEQWVSHCRAKVGEWEDLMAQHEASLAAEQAKRASGWRPTLDQLAARLKAR